MKETFVELSVVASIKGAGRGEKALSGTVHVSPGSIKGLRYHSPGKVVISIDNLFPVMAGHHREFAQLVVKGTVESITELITGK